MKVAIIGAGNLGIAIMKNAAKNAEIVAVRRRKELIPKLDNVIPASDIEEAKDCNIFIVTLKPNTFRKNMKIIGEIVKGKPLISFAAGVKLDEMLKYIENPYRAMTNLAIEEKSVVACYPPEAAEHLRFLNAEFLYCNDENELDAMTSFIGSSPAIISKLIHGFIIAALNEGVSYKNALKAAISSFEAASFLYSKYGLENVIERVATPSGTTASGLVEVLDAERKFINSLITASRRGKEI